MTSPLAVYFIDDDTDVREAICFLLATVGLKPRGFADALGFLAALPTLPPGCIVTDIRMPHLTGHRLQERLTEAHCTWPVIVITGHGDVEACRRAFRAGAVDFLTKPVDEHVLIEAVQGALAKLGTELSSQKGLDDVRGLVGRLSPREAEILAQIADGASTKEIARTLDVSPRTIDTHRAHIAEKLGTTSVAEMVRMYLKAVPGAHP